MRKFITTIALQPEGKLNSTVYEAVGNDKLKYNKDTRFPVIPLIAGYTGKGENIEVIALRHDYDNSRYNFKLFKEEMEQLSKDKGFSYSIKELEIPYDNRTSTHLSTFKKLAAMIDDEDEISACITYGTKPLSVVEFMTVNYAYRAKKNCSIGAIVYGEFDHSDNKSKIYDITSLFFVDEMVRRSAESGRDTMSLLNGILDEGGET